MRALIPLILLLLPTVLFAQAAPKYVERVGPYEVRFSAVPTADLPAEIARRYELTRSQQELLVNVHVRRVDEEPLGKAVAADISASVRSLIGQQRALEMREIKQGDAIYYIASMRMADPEERWVFDLNVTPEDATTTFTVRFERQFN